MRRSFEGWRAVAEHLQGLADAGGRPGWSLNEGQCASVRALGARLPSNGVVIADEVGMGKTRIAIALAHSVIKAGGRVAILVPPGLGFQWQDELRGGGVEAPALLRSLWQFLEGCRSLGVAQKPWFAQNLVMVSHAFTNWRLGEDSSTWRWALLPALYAFWRRETTGRVPNGFNPLQEGRQPWPGRGYATLDEWWVDTPLQAARSIVGFIKSLPQEHPARRQISDLSSNTPWPDVMARAGYRRDHGLGLRPGLEQAVGLGLGVFDLVIIDEAHKSRGDESGLSRMLDSVVLRSDVARRVALTATPVELDASQWHQTLGRIDAQGVGYSEAEGDIFQRYSQACAWVRARPHNEQAQHAFKHVAALFQQTLRPYLLRRDKRELKSVRDYAACSGAPMHGYRRELEIPVDTRTLSPAWKQAVCAAEALSVVTRQADDPLSKRLRLTIGNGHGIAAILDRAKQDDERDRQQQKLDGDITTLPDQPDTLGNQDKRQQRATWWKSVIGKAFQGSDDPLFDHPAILAAVTAIEEVTQGSRPSAEAEKVLVFGRFTAPLQAMVTLLNARAMLRALDRAEPWAQAKVHDDEWAAVQAAHRQLERVGVLERARLDLELEKQYRALEASRRQDREQLLQLLERGLSKIRAQQLFIQMRRAIERHEGSGDSPLVLVAKALHALTPKHDSPTHLAEAFEELVEALCEREEGYEGSDDLFGAQQAENLWNQLQDRLKDEFSRQEGGFARLMYGGTQARTRRLIQLAFNRPHSHPRVLVTQSVVGREGLNLHKACKTVVLLHPEWNPGVVEQQIGRVDRVGSLWERTLEQALSEPGAQLPTIQVRPVVFRGTYDEGNWSVLRERWDDLRAQLHGVVISPSLKQAAGLSEDFVDNLNASAPSFSPLGDDDGSLRQEPLPRPACRKVPEASS